MSDRADNPVNRSMPVSVIGLWNRVPVHHANLQRDPAEIVEIQSRQRSLLVQAEH